MKKIFVSLFAFGLILSCSSSDDSHDQQDPTQGHYSLVLNGAGYTNERVELIKDTINFVGPGTLFSASDSFNNAIGVVVPTSGEGTTSIVEYDETLTNPSGYQADAASFYIGGNTYRSEDGVFVVEDFELIDNTCAYWRGNLNINLTLEGQGADVLNVQGTFDIPAYGCDD